MASCSASLSTTRRALEVALAEEQPAELDLVEEGAVDEPHRPVGLLRVEDLSRAAARSPRLISSSAAFACWTAAFTTSPVTT